MYRREDSDHCASPLGAAAGRGSECRSSLRQPAAANLKRRYGLTEAEVAERIEARGGRCAICRTKPAEHVDTHLTGDVRGILCFSCNVGLGIVGDSDHLMRLAADDLQGHQSTDPATLPDGFPEERDLSAGLLA